jgi:hypothetical protein
MTESKPWPPTRVVQAAIRGVWRSVFRTEDGVTTAGVRSTEPWIYLTITPALTELVCERCEDAERLPQPPQTQAGPGQPRGDLFGTETRNYALYVLTGTLYPFYRKHEACARREPVPAAQPSEETPAA